MRPHSSHSLISYIIAYELVLSSIHVKNKTNFQLKIVWTVYSLEYRLHRLGVGSARAIFNNIIFVQVAFECFPLTYLPAFEIMPIAFILSIHCFGVIISLPVALLTDWNFIRLKLGLLFCLLYTHKTSLKLSFHLNNFPSVITGIVLIVWTVYSSEYRLHCLVLVAQKQYILVAFLTRIFSHVFCFFLSD